MYRVTVIATDPHGRDGSLTATVQIADVDEPPEVSGPDTVDFQENGATAVATYSADDPERATLAWSLQGVDREAFRITSRGALHFRTPPDYEVPVDTGGKNDYQVTVVATDRTHTDSFDVAVSVTAVNEPPEITSGAARLTYQESGVATVQNYGATDPDSGDTVTWLLQGRDASAFTIAGGALRFVTPPVHEEKSSYTVVVAASDGKDDAGEPQTTPTADDSVAVTIAIIGAGVNEPPEITSGPDSVDYLENGTNAVATYRANDPERGTITWSLSGSDAGSFSISDAGDLAFLMPPDHESRVSYQVIVTATDPPGLSDTVNVTINVTDANEAPVVTGPVNVRFEENGTGVVASYNAIDPDTGDVPVWLLSGRDARAFDIQGGTLRFLAPPDREAKASYEVVVGVGDGEDASGNPETTPRADNTITLNVSIANVDEPPGFTSGPERVDYAENGTGAVATYRATDPEGVAALWRLSGPDGDDFSISISGVLTFTAPPGYEDFAGVGGSNAYQVTVEAFDGVNTASRSVTVTVGNEDEPGTLVLSSEQPQVGAPLTATLDEPDGGLGALTWTWERSQDRRTWTVVTGATLERYTPLDADLGFYLRATVAYEDGHGPGKSAREMSDRQVRSQPAGNSAPAFMGLRPRRNVPENAAPGTLVGAPVVFSDTDGDPLAYALLGGGTHLFTIDRASGQIRVAPGSRLDHEGNGSHSLTVTATDPSNAPGTVVVEVTVTDVNEPPEAANDTASTSEEETVFIDVLQNDDDPEDDALTLAIRTRPANGFVSVESDNTLTYTPNPNFHGVDVFTYTVSDGPQRSEATVVITVSPVNDPPAFPDAVADRGVPAGAAPGADVGQPVAARDADGDIPEYRLSGTDAASFDIDDNSGQVTVADATVIDPAVQTIYNVVVTATDSSGTSSTVTLTITVGGSAATFGGGGGGGGGGPSGPSPSEVDFEWTVKHDIEELDSGHDRPTGSWSDGKTLWLLENGDGADDAIYAYDLESGERAEDREFELHETNRAPRGVWFDSKVTWVSDSGQERLFAYDLATGKHVEEREINLAPRNADARGIWSDGETMWVLDGVKDSLFAYDLESGELLAEYALHPGNGDPRGIWSDGVTIWISDDGLKQLWAYRLPALPDGAEPSEEERALERVRDEDFTNLSGASNNSPRGIWSDGGVMYVADESDGKVYTYNLPDAIDTRLASLSLSGVDIGEFDPGRTEYEGTVGDGVTETTVTAEALQRRTDVDIDPSDADEEAEGHQVALQGVSEITVTVTSADGSRRRTYRVAFAPPVMELVLSPTWTSFEWPGADGTAVIDALREGGISDRVLVIYEWDEAAQTWLAYFPGLGDVLGLNTLTTLRQGSTYWVAVTEPLTWSVANSGAALAAAARVP